ncbi:hypothetical protein [Actinocatenispora rupis]|uniref:Secreted protein n=1 Tax=Actinocatenispora rupis TaxID=519421 RepID=A0A8J3NA80_9ACTN|nr:hypothetical protein [Actinocatenispora rupis]GID09440.1 hypothetical protein Aru02nite_03290 [Actinocatenispora rupis]
MNDRPRWSRRNVFVGGALAGLAATGVAAFGAPTSALAETYPEPVELAADAFRLTAGPSNTALLHRLDRLLPVTRVTDVLDGADRVGAAATPHANGLTRAFTWNDEDGATELWYPQGVSTSADAHPSGRYDGRTVIFASWYSKSTAPDMGSRVSFIDYSNPAAPRYRHVLLVEPYVDDAGNADFRAVPVHAGGIIVYGHLLFVVDTWNGFRVFDLRHVWQVDDTDPTAVGRADDGTYRGYGHAYVLPQSVAYLSSTVDGVEPLRYSCCGLDRSGPTPSVIVAEYNVEGEDRTGAGARVVRFPLDPYGPLFATEGDGQVHGTEAYQVFVRSVQGGVAHGGRFFLSRSNGTTNYSGLVTFTAGTAPALASESMPVGTEDLAYWPGRDEVWTLCEHPGKRFVLAVRASAF